MHVSPSLRRWASLAGLIAVLTAMLAAPPATHAARGQMKLAVQITAIHVVDWSMRGANHPQTCKAWSKGEGTQTTGFSTPRALRYTALSTPRIGDVPPRFVLLGPASAPRFRATVSRKGDWEDHAVPMTAECTPCGPLSEYGECKGEDPPLAPLYRCGREKIKQPGAMLGYVPAGGEGRDGLAPLVDTLSVQVSAPTRKLFPHCPPELANGTGHELKHPDPLPVDIVGASARRLQRLKPGSKVTLKGSAEAGFVEEGGAKTTQRCSAATLQGTGYRECAVTDVTVEVRRLR